MRKGVFVTLVMALLGALLLNPASAAVKAGTTCTKLNQKTSSAGYTYTCIKSGKKLVWSKGVKVSMPIPTPTPPTSPTAIGDPVGSIGSNPIPLPTASPTISQTPAPMVNLTVRELALKEVKARWDANKNNVGSVTLYLQPDLPNFVSNALKDSATNAMRLYGKDFLPDATLFAGTKSDWYTKTFCEYRYPSEMWTACEAGSYGGPGSGSGWPQEFPQVDAYGAVYGAITKTSTSGTEYLPSPAYIYLSSFKDKNSLSSSVYSSPAHELFHALQQFQFGGGDTTSQSASNISTKLKNVDCSNYLSQCPSLWVEGSAFYFGYASAEMSNPGILNNQGLPLKPNWLTSERFSLDQVLQWNVSEMMRSPYKGNYAYLAGGLMTEALVAAFGIQKVFEFTKNSSLGLTDTSYTFATNFKRSFGVEWISWSSKAELYLQNSLDGKVTYAKDLDIPVRN